MNYRLSEAAAALIARDELQSYSVDGNSVTIIKKPPKHYAVNLKVINKNARQKHKAAVVVDKSWTYPKELESEVCWDILYTLRDFALEHEEVQKSWNEIFGEKHPVLFIAPPKPVPDEPRVMSIGDYFNFGVRKFVNSDWYQAYYRDEKDEVQVIGNFKNYGAAKRAAQEYVDRQRLADTSVNDLEATDV